MDFIVDGLANGRMIRILSVVDAFTRECLVLEADTGLGSGRVTRELDRLIEHRGQPESVRSDNGPEFTSRRMLGWAEERKINLIHIQPGRPMQNGHVESFHGRLRDECLNTNWFRTLNDVRRTLDNWRQEYNCERPHSSLAYRTPAEFSRALGYGDVESKQRFPLLEWSAVCFRNGWAILLCRRLTMEIATLGIDLSKTTFHIVGLDRRGEIVLRRKLSRRQLLLFTANRSSMLIGMEACGGAHFLGRALREQGHEVRLMPAQYVKPYVKTNKNDYLDAEAIAEAGQRPTMRFVPIKTDEQLDLQALHRVRDRWVARRTAIMNQMRGFLLERGMTVRKGPSHLMVQLQEVLREGGAFVSARLHGLLRELKQEWDELDRRIEQANDELQRIAREDDACHRLMEVPGFGPLVSTALVAAIGNGITFQKGRELSAWIGLVPRQCSTGGKTKLLGISKRGNPYLRRMFLHGARSVVAQAERNPSALSTWLADLAGRTHRNVVVVALANKMARIAWAILSKGIRYRTSELVVA